MLMSKQEQSNHEVLVSLEGEFDAHACEEIKPEFEKLVGDQLNQNVVLDLSAVTFIDSSGIGAIVFLYKRLMQANSTFHLCGVRGQPRELFELLRINKAIPTSWHDQSLAS